MTSGPQAREGESLKQVEVSGDAEEGWTLERFLRKIRNNKGAHLVGDRRWEVGRGSWIGAHISRWENGQMSGNSSPESWFLYRLEFVSPAKSEKMGVGEVGGPAKSVASMVVFFLLPRATRARREG